MSEQKAAGSGFSQGIQRCNMDQFECLTRKTAKNGERQSRQSSVAPHDEGGEAPEKRAP